MSRWQSKSIAWVLIACMAVSPTMVYAARLAPPEGQEKADLGYVTPNAAAAAVAFPRRVLTAPEMEMMPLEVITAAGIKEAGFDPLDIDWALAFFEMPENPAAMAGPPPIAIVLHSVKPFPEGKLFGRLWDCTTEAQLDGKTYRKAMTPADASIYRPDANTVVIATDDFLPRVLKNHAAPQEGRVTQVLGRMKEMPDAAAIVFVEPLRPLLMGPLMKAPLLMQLAGVKQIPDLLTSVGLKVNARGNQSIALTARANDEKAAEQLEQIVDQVFTFARQSMTAGIARQENSPDPVERAGAKYGKRVTERMFEFLRPVRQGDKLTFSTDSGKNQQMTSMATIGMLVAMLLPAVQAAREAARRAQSSNNMKNIGLAMHSYAQAHHKFPPAYSVDKNGKPLLSWRVLILPYLDQQDLYEQFKLDEPWDSAHNKALIARMPGVYRSPSSAQFGQGWTNYLTPRGERTIFPGKEAIGFAQITDGTSNTILTLEMPFCVEWTRPQDFEYDGDAPMKRLLGLRAGGFLAGMADGSVRFISSTLDRAALKALFTRNGGEKVGLDNAF